MIQIEDSPVSKYLIFNKLFGLDFMIDTNFKPWLIEINANPCLELSCILLARIIPPLIDNTLRIAVDPIFASSNWNKSRHSLQGNSLFQNKYELIYDELIEMS